MKSTFSAQQMRLGVICLAIVMALFVPGHPGWGHSSDEIVGTISVIDGDTFEIGGKIVHLDGIDAPELGQTCLLKNKRWKCGRVAALALKKLAAVSQVVCKPTSRNNIGLKAVCVSGSIDLAENMLKSGYAVTLKQVSPTYKSAEASAKSASLGLWRSKFVRPWDWRRGVRLPGGPADEVTICDIKGAIDSRGERILYLPSDKGYEEIKINKSKGERMFCSDDAALIAGWKKFSTPW